MNNLKSIQYFLMTIFFVGFITNIKGQNHFEKVDSLLEAKFSSNGPGASFLIAKSGKVIYQKALGMANLENKVKMHENHVFEIGSMTKQFTAISIMMLEEKGLLSVDDEITKYIPDYPTKDQKITIHHLLTHTSGIKNYTSIRGIQKIAKKEMEPKALIDFFKDAEMDFIPGEKFKYSNSGYVILGFIIEKISGESYAEFVKKNIFDPLNMTSSRYASKTDLIRNRASGYHKRKGYINNRQISYSIPYASGSLMSCVSDLFKWNEAIKNNRLLSKSTTKRIFTNYTLNNGKPIKYGYGWHLKQINQMESREHGGHIFGFKSMGVYLPGKDLYVVGLSNCDCNSPTQITRDIAALVLE